MPSPRPVRSVSYRQRGGLVLALLTIAASFLVAPVRAGASTAPKPLRITTRALPAPTAGGAYRASLAAIGGRAPYHWTITKGRLPKGLTLSSAGVITGTPRTASGAIFTAAVTDATTPTAQHATAALAVDVGPQRLYIANGGANSITEYSLAPKGNIPPVASIAGSLSSPESPAAIALSGSGEFYVVDTEASAVLVYAAGATNQSPVRVIYGPDTQLAQPLGLAVDRHGNLYATNLETNTITEYAPDADADAAPIAVIGGDQTALTSVGGITIDPYGNIIVGAGQGYLDKFAPGSDGNVAPTLEIGGPATGIAFAIALASTGNDLYVLSRSQNGTAIIDLAENALGDAAPRSTIAGADTRLLNGGGIAADDLGHVYVTNENLDSNAAWVTTFAAGATGDAAPIAVLAGNRTGLSGPWGIAVGASLYVTTTQLPAASVGTPYSQALGTALGVAPYHWTGFLGTLPAGLHLSRAGVISGTPTTPGVSTFDLDVRDAASTSVIVTLSIDVGVPPLEYVANSSFTSSSVIAFKPGETGNSTPFIDITGPDTGIDQPQAIAFDGFGDLYVANYSGTITEYAPDATGDAAPIRTIAGPHTGLLTPSALAFDSLGNLFVANGLGNDVLEFAPGASGDVTPHATITGFSNPVAVALDPQGALWVNNGDMLESVQPVTGPAMVTATLGGADTGLNGVKGIVFDADGWLHVSNLNANAETLYRPGAVGDARPVQSVAISLPWGVAADAAGRVTVASNAAPYGIASFGRFGSAPVSLTGPATGIAQPTGIAITPQ